MAVEALNRPVSTSQVNLQVKADKSTLGVQDSKKSANAAQTDTVTLSAQALKMADEKSASTREETKKADEQKAAQLASEKADAAKRAAQANQSNAAKAYAAFSANP